MIESRGQTYWLRATGFIAVLSCLCGPLQAQQSTDDAASGLSPGGDAFGLPIRIIEDQESSEARAASEIERAQREEEGLRVQQRMADATEAVNDATQSMKAVSWYSFYAVLAGTVLLFVTLCLTLATIVVTRRIGEAQTAPYLGTGLNDGRSRKGDFFFGRTGGDKDGSLYLKARPFILNYGHTPAHDIILDYEILVMNGDNGVDRPKVWKRSGVHKGQQCGSISPRQVIEPDCFFDLAISKEDESAMAKKDLRVVLRGSVSWVGKASSKRDRTEFVLSGESFTIGHAVDSVGKVLAGRIDPTAGRISETAGSFLWHAPDRFRTKLP